MRFARLIFYAAPCNGSRGWLFRSLKMAPTYPDAVPLDDYLCGEVEMEERLNLVPKSIGFARHFQNEPCP